MDTFMETLQSLQNTPVPNLLVIAGLIFLFLAFIGKFGGYIELNEKRQKGAGLLGGILLVCGIILFLIPASQLNTSTDTQASSDKPNPEVTYTPTPTNVPRVTPAPTATIDADPTVYDNFNNPAFDNTFNPDLWQYLSDVSGQVLQQEGQVVFSQEGKSGNTGLMAQNYNNFTLQSAVLFSAKLKVKDPQEGHVFLHLGSNLSSSDYSDCTLGYGDKQAIFKCSYIYNEKVIYTTAYSSINYNEWQTAGIRVEPSTMTFIYYV